MSIDNRFKKNAKIIDAVSYNGKYVDSRVIRNRALSITAAIAALICFVVIIIL